SRPASNRRRIRATWSNRSALCSRTGVRPASSTTRSPPAGRVAAGQSPPRHRGVGGRTGGRPAITHRCSRWLWQSGRGVVAAQLGEEVGRRGGMIRREPVGLGQRNVLLVGGPAGRSCGGSLLLVLHVQLPPVPRRRDHSRPST